MRRDRRPAPSPRCRSAGLPPQVGAISAELGHCKRMLRPWVCREVVPPLSFPVFNGEGSRCMRHPSPRGFVLNLSTEPRPPARSPTFSGPAATHMSWPTLMAGAGMSSAAPRSWSARHNTVHKRATTAGRPSEARREERATSLPTPMNVHWRRRTLPAVRSRRRCAVALPKPAEQSTKRHTACQRQAMCHHGALDSMLEVSTSRPSTPPRAHFRRAPRFRRPP